MNPVAEAEKISGWMGAAELNWLHRVASSQKPGSIWVEVGSWAGRSLVSVGLSLPRESQLVAVDRFSGCPGMTDEHTQLAKQSLSEVIEYLRHCSDGVSVQFLEMSSVDAAAMFLDETCDVVFLDGDHDTDSVAADIAAWLPKVKSGGILCGHDGNYPSVLAAVVPVFGWPSFEQTIWYTQVKRDG